MYAGFKQGEPDIQEDCPTGNHIMIARLRDGVLNQPEHPNLYHQERRIGERRKRRRHHTYYMLMQRSTYLTFGFLLKLL